MEERKCGKNPSNSGNQIAALEPRRRSMHSSIRISRNPLMIQDQRFRQPYSISPSEKRKERKDSQLIHPKQKQNKNKKQKSHHPPVEPDVCNATTASFLASPYDLPLRCCQNRYRSCSVLSRSFNAGTVGDRISIFDVEDLLAFRMAWTRGG